MTVLLWLERLWQDLRHACRVFAKAPGFTAIAIVSIACGTGANVAMFSLADALLLRPLPVPRPGELLVVGSRIDIGRATDTVASYPDYADIAEASSSFTGVLAYIIASSGVQFEPRAAPQVKLVQLVSGTFFDLLGVQPEMGRGFTAAEDRVPGRDAVAVLSHGVWQQQYGGDPMAVGRTIRIGIRDFTIVGVLPERFTGLETRTLSQIVYVPLAMAPSLGDAGMAGLLETRDQRVLSLRARLKPDVSVGQARADLAAIGVNLERAHPSTNRGIDLIAETQLEARVRTNYIDAGLVALLSILSTAVLAVACANVAGLLSSRAPLRAREISLRLAVGAGRGRLVRQLVTESLLLAVAGGIGGLAVGYIGIGIIGQIEYPTDMVGLPAIQIDRRALLFNIAVAMASAFGFGLGPALQTTRVDLAGAMKAGEPVPPGGRLRGRANLVALQLALSLVLVTVAAFTYQTFDKVSTAGPGFRTTRVAKITVDTAYRKYRDTEAVALFERAIADASRLPGVTSATAISTMPLWGLETIPIVPEGYRPPDGLPGVESIVASVHEGYFATMGIPIVRGRGFLVTDDADSDKVAIVNETLALRYWPGRDPVGQRFRLGGEDGPWAEIVGVARDSKYFYIVEPPQDALYLPFRQQPRSGMVLLAATSDDATPVVGALREAIRSLDPDLPAFEAQTIETFYAARAVGFVKVGTEMIGGMGVMGVLLTMVGLYGLVSYSVSRRTREIGIRMAVGATCGHVIRMIVGQGLKPAWVGLPAGIVLSVLVGRAMPVILPMGERFDRRLFALIVPVLLAVAALAAVIPARRAARVNPTEALRYE